MLNNKTLQSIITEIKQTGDSIKKDKKTFTQWLTFIKKPSYVLVYVTPRLILNVIAKRKTKTPRPQAVGNPL